MKKLLLAVLAAGWSFVSMASGPKDAAAGLIHRMLPHHADQIRVEIIPAAENGRDVFEIGATNGRVVLRGNNPVSVASALNEYLKRTALAHLSWCGDQLDLPAKLPLPRTPVRTVNPSQRRVYFNYCTLSYTASWWDWKRWEREIDFMAMNGINTPLGVTGIEGAWYHTLLRMGFTDAEAREFLVGPDFQAWQWMQNIERYGGPLPKSWIDSHIKLGRQILDRERELGMTPIQQGFSGAVPRRLKEKFPDAAMKQQPMWCGSFEGTMQLDPVDPLFRKMGTIFLEEQQRLFGTSHLYGCDPFHESAPPKPGADYLKQVGESITALLTNHDAQATWCMQSWSIRKEIATTVPKDRLLVLDLGSRWRSTESFWGYPFVAGTIHNFGGRTHLGGELAGLAKNPFAAALRASTNCVGMGLFPEAIEQNPVYYDLVFDLVWRDGGVEIEPWLHDYVRRRYGAESDNAQQAWTILLATAYSHGCSYGSPFAARPALDLRKADPNWGISMPYDPAELTKAWELLLVDADKLGKSAGYRFDVADIGRQVLADLAQPMHWEVAGAFVAHDTNGLAAASKQFLELFDDADRLIGTQPTHSFRKWVRDAQAWARNADERALYTFDASMLVTLWGGDTTPKIFDYSWREWGGLIGDFYRTRWAKFHAMLAEHLVEGQDWTEQGLKEDYGRPSLQSNPVYRNLYDWEMSWIRADRKYDADTAGDAVAIAKELLAKYKPSAVRMFSPEGRARWAQLQDSVRNRRQTDADSKSIWRWEPSKVGTQWRDVSIDLTKALSEGSDYEVTFIYENGGARLDMRNAVIEQDGTAVARDDHTGGTGSAQVKNTYSFHLPMVVPGAKYTLKLQVRTDGSNNSYGAAWLRKKR